MYSCRYAPNMFTWEQILLGQGVAVVGEEEGLKSCFGTVIKHGREVQKYLNLSVTVFSYLSKYVNILSCV